MISHVAINIIVPCSSPLSTASGTGSGMRVLRRIARTQGQRRSGPLARYGRHERPSSVLRACTNADARAHIEFGILAGAVLHGVDSDIALQIGERCQENIAAENQSTNAEDYCSGAGNVSISTASMEPLNLYRSNKCAPKLGQPFRPTQAGARKGLLKAS